MSWIVKYVTWVHKFNTNLKIIIPLSFVPQPIFLYSLSRIHICLFSYVRPCVQFCVSAYGQIVFYIKFYSICIFLYVRAYVELWLQIKTTSRQKIAVFKMASINKHPLLAVVLVILKRRRRRKNRKNKKKRIWVKIMNENRLEFGAFSATFLLTRELDRASFKQIRIYPSDCLSPVFD